jgi:RNA polymerase sigma factor (sigma-70 family)
MGMDFDGFMRKHGALVGSIARQATRKVRHLREDIEQAALLGVVRGLKSYDGPDEEAPRLAHVTGTCRTEVNRVLRPELRHRNATAPFSDPSPDEDDGQEDVVDPAPLADEQLRQLRLDAELAKLVAKLPPPQRAVAEARILADSPATLNAVASRLGISLWAVRHAENLARRRLLQLARAHRLID